MGRTRNMDNEDRRNRFDLFLKRKNDIATYNNLMTGLFCRHYERSNPEHTAKRFVTRKLLFRHAVHGQVNHIRIPAFDLS